MKEQIQSILNNHTSDAVIIKKINEVINDYKRKKRGRLMYNIPEGESLVEISNFLSVNEMSSRAIHERLKNYKKKGFSTSMEVKNRVLTNELCRYFKMTRDEILVDFEG